MTTQIDRDQAANTLQAQCLEMLAENWLNATRVAPMAAAFLEVVSPRTLHGKMDTAERARRALDFLRGIEGVQMKGHADPFGKKEVHDFAAVKAPLWTALLEEILRGKATIPLIDGLLSTICLYSTGDDQGEDKALKKAFRAVMRDTYHDRERLVYILSRTTVDSNRVVVKWIAHALVDLSSNEELRLAFE